MNADFTATKTRKTKRNKMIGVAGAVVVVIIGYALIISRAAGFFVSSDPQNTQRTGNVTLITEANGTSALQFNAPVTTPPPPPPQPPAGQLPANTLPAGNDVGFLGNAANLITADATRVPPGMVYSSGDGVFRLSSVSTRTYEGYRFTRPVVLSGTLPENAGVTLTFKNNIFAVPGNQPYGGLTYQTDNGVGNNHIIVQDNTFTSTTLTNYNFGNGHVQIDSRCTIQRNNIGGRADGIQNGNGQCLIEQNYIHSPALLGTADNGTHNDGMQFYGGSGIVIRYNRVDIGWDGWHQSGAVFFQGNFSGPVIDNNFLSGGGITLRLESGVSGAVVTNNTFKLPSPIEHPQGWGPYTHSIEGRVTTWSGNKLFPNNTPVPQ